MTILFEGQYRGRTFRSCFGPVGQATLSPMHSFPLNACLACSNETSWHITLQACSKSNQVIGLLQKQLTEPSIGPYRGPIVFSIKGVTW